MQALEELSRVREARDDHRSAQRGAQLVWSASVRASNQQKLMQEMEPKRRPRRRYVAGTFPKQNRELGVRQVSADNAKREGTVEQCDMDVARGKVNANALALSRAVCRDLRLRFHWFVRCR